MIKIKASFCQLKKLTFDKLELWQMQQNCRLTSIIISIMITVCIIFMIYGFILAFIFSASVIGFYIYYLIENKKKQTLFLNTRQLK